MTQTQEELIHSDILVRCERAPKCDVRYCKHKEYHKWKEVCEVPCHRNNSSMDSRCLPYHNPCKKCPYSPCPFGGRFE